MAGKKTNPISSMAALGEPERLQLLLDAVTDYAIYLLDLDGNVSSWNTGAQRFKGYTATEIIGQHFSRFYTEPDRDAGLPERALRIAAAEGTFEAEGWRVRKDGTRFWTSVVIDPVRDRDGELIGFAKVTRDIGHKREAERRLRESEQRFRMLVEGVRDYAIYMLDPGGIVTNWNAGAQAIKGYSAREIVGQHFSRFYTEADRSSGEPARALEIARTEGKYEREAQRVRKDGSLFWAHVVIDPIYGETGELSGFAKITRDVTERRLAQEQIETAREALAQSQKLEAIGRLTGGVAHDFNNLLTVIRGSAELLRRPGLTEDKRDRYLEAIAETADRAAVLTGQLLAFARQQPLRPQTFEVAMRLDGMEHIIATTIGASIAYHIKVGPDAGSIDADPSQFETAILNMVVNARDAMPSGGDLTIAIERVTVKPAIRHHAAVESDFVRVTVRDTGTGIAPDTVTRIFEPFFTTKDVSKGTGLGLSQVYGFAKQSGGDIAVESVLGEGTSFSLYLPRVDAAAGQPSIVRPPEGASPIIGERRILLVEDNETVGRFALSALTELGQRVVWAPNASAALEQLENGEAFDLVFSDIVMPGMSGIELAEIIKQKWPSIPVVLTSGYSHLLSEPSGHRFDLVQKPYSMVNLVALLSSPPE
jgi:PAS domain S-box-containing protein